MSEACQWARACITDRYAVCMAQLVTRIPDALLAEIDELVAHGEASSRSALVRAGLERILDEHRRRKVGEAIADAYRRQPEREGDATGLHAATKALIEEEPW